MNKIVFASALAAGLVAGGVSFAGAAPMVSGMSNPYYVGIGVNYGAKMTDKITDNDGDVLKLNSRGVGANVFGGYRVNHYFGVEGGYAYLGQDKYKETTVAGVDTNNYVRIKNQWNLHFVGNAYLPVCDWFEPYAFGGVSYSSYELNYLGSAKDTNSSFGLIYGAGLQFNVIDQLSVRASYTRQDTASNANFDSITPTGGSITADGIKAPKDYISLDVLWKFNA